MAVPTVALTLSQNDGKRKIEKDRRQNENPNPDDCRIVQGENRFSRSQEKLNKKDQKASAQHKPEAKSNELCRYIVNLLDCVEVSSFLAASDGQRLRCSAKKSDTVQFEAQKEFDVEAYIAQLGPSIHFVTETSSSAVLGGIGAKK